MYYVLYNIAKIMWDHRQDQDLFLARALTVRNTPQASNIVININIIIVSTTSIRITIIRNINSISVVSIVSAVSIITIVIIQHDAVLALDTKHAYNKKWALIQPFRECGQYYVMP